MTRTTLRWMGYNSRRPLRVPLISTTNRKKRLQFARTHQNRTVDDCKNVAWSDESRFLLRHSDGRVRIWRTELDHGFIMPCYLCAGWWWCNGMGDVFLAHFSPLSANWASFKCHGLPEHCFDHVHPFMATMYPSSDGYFQQDNAPFHKA